ncbi:MAG: Ig-like domain-containing protein [Fidelibacterota bacterium]
MDHLLSDPPDLAEGAVYAIVLTGVDRAGNASEDVGVDKVTFDTRAPVITLDVPEDSSHQNQSRISYVLSERLAEGAVTWTRSGGSPDNGSPHVVTLADTFLEEGTHLDVLLTPPLSLRDGAVYTVEFNGEDRAGNRATAGKSLGVVYDETPPIILLTSPVADSHINTSSLSYELSETLNEAVVVWNHSGGQPDMAAPHRISLEGPSLSAGPHVDLVPREPPELVSGATYTLVFQGTDRAGNAAETVTVSGVTFDNESPTIAVTKPKPSTFVSSPLVSYSLSERLDSLHVRWVWEGGEEDPRSPHTLQLGERELDAGNHPDVEPSSFPDLVDGSVYSVVFAGSDLAGNEAHEVVVDPVTFDAVPPTLALMLPERGSVINSAEVSYRISENLSQGVVVWKRMGGTEDPLSPHASALASSELLAGVYENLTLTETPPLVDGSVYRIVLSGQDPAGNRADSVVVDSVLFDVSPPVIVANSPAPSGAVNSPVVSYSLSEDLREGSITWTRTGGVEDPGSPHVQSLASGELTAGDHQEITIESLPDLVSGGIYSLAFDGWDRAGNRASGMVIESVTFDSVRPVLILRTSGESPYLNAPRLTYRLSESLREGEVAWTWESGQADPDAPYASRLTREELSAGEHADIQLTEAPDLKDGAVYTITLSGSDAAGNEGEPATLTGITFDATPPVLTVTAPVQGQFINSTAVTYGLSEGLAEGRAIWTRTGGSDDPQSPHSFSLVQEELAPGDHRDIVLANQEPLVEDAVYSLNFSGRDPAGNTSGDVTVENLTFDSVPPRLVLEEPGSGASVNDFHLTYTVSESLASGFVSVVRTGGEEDPSSPYEIELTGETLSEGRHEEVILPQLPSLVSGAVYTVTFGGKDFAQNEAEPVTAEQVAFDDTPPVLAVTVPGNSTHVNHVRLTYELSEPLADGQVTWAPKDGGPPQVSTMTETERQGGIHEEIVLENSPELVDGKAYDIVFEGTDSANNQASPVTITGVTYDITAPKLKVELNSPIPRTFKKDTPVSITSSEVMSEIVFTWVSESGVSDPGSPHRLSVPEEFLEEGTHDGITLPGIEDLQEGTSYTLTVSGKDLAGNESRPQSVENIDLIRDLKGDWLWKGALLTAIWTFQEGGGFSQGVVMGTRIQEKEVGRYKVDFTTRPYELTIQFESGVRRFALFEFTGSNTMRVVAGEKKPASWSDGDLMDFEFRQTEVP